MGELAKDVKAQQPKQGLDDKTLRLIGMCQNELSPRYGRLFDALFSFYDGASEDEEAEYRDEINNRIFDSSPEELFAFGREKFIAAVDSGNYGAANQIAFCLNLKHNDPSLKSHFDAIDDAYKRDKEEKRDKEVRDVIDEYDAIDDPSEQYAFLEEFFESHRGHNLSAHPEISDLHDEYLTLKVQKGYKDKKKAKKGEAFDQAIRILRLKPELLSSWTEQMQARIHRDAVGAVDAAIKKGWSYRGQAPSDLVGFYMDLGILDFDKDEDLIERATKS